MEPENKITLPGKISPEDMKKSDEIREKKKKDTLSSIAVRVKKVEDRLDLVMNFSAGSFYTASGAAYISGPWWLGPLLTVLAIASSYMENLIRKVKEKYGASISDIRKEKGLKVMTRLKV